MIDRVCKTPQISLVISIPNIQGDGDRERKRVHLLRVLGAAALTSDELKGLHGICAQVLHALSSARGGTEPGAR